MGADAERNESHTRRKRLMRTAFGWFVGIVVVAAVGFALGSAGAALGIPMFITLDDPITISYYKGPDVETSDLATMFGYAAMGFTLLVGSLAGRAAYVGRWDAGFTKKEWFSLFAWLMALSILMVVFVLTDLALRRFSGSLASYTGVLIEFGAVAGVGWACRQWWKNRIKQVSSDERP